ncbi:succinate dehydrogenase cytochrome b subunit [Naumannella halotolerans]|uniref:Succinate dehydrogenase / fumarate reductase cytochrome b subunit n=1 Tax=Naumannella halotolerans TaxID=993414 RepID=A0A4R7J918_9ACTN|nr:succinate dehydrogenase cytochrome b subunit [Naumannella halotolerans]TDT33815.1 succinate dehydrogenase / fumarate reductase cytochrome b subunit [Naumannella halotolerans]
MTTVDRPPTAGTSPPRPMISNFWAKTIMAITGLIFAAFVFVHMYGNLHIYYGAQAFDEYAHWLRTLLEPLLPYSGVLWILRVVLLICLVLHVGCAVLLHVRSRQARGPHRRPGLRRTEAWLARSMLASGVIIGLFVIFHILDLTIGLQPAATDVFTHGAAYANLVASFRRPLVAAFYILAMLVLSAHLAHGIWAAANDLGATGKRLRQVAVIVAGLVALAVCVGNISIPVMVLTGGLQ